MSSKNIFLKFFQGNQPKGASGRRVVGERGSNDLPPGKKGGETMTPMTSMAALIPMWMKNCAAGWKRS